MLLERCKVSPEAHVLHVASKVDSREHGVDLTPKAIDDSLKNLGTGVYQASSHMLIVEPS